MWLPREVEQVPFRILSSFVSFFLFLSFLIACLLACFFAFVCVLESRLP
jgi:hypothetical protein